MAISAVAKVGRFQNGVRNAKKVSTGERSPASSKVERAGAVYTAANDNLPRAANDNWPAAGANPTGDSLARPPLRNIEHNTGPRPKGLLARLPNSPSINRLNNLTKLKGAGVSGAEATSTKAKMFGWFMAFATMIREFWFLASLWPAQVLFGVISLVGFGMEEAAGEFLGGIFSFVVPGVTVWIVGLGVVMIIGIGSMLTAAIMLRIVHKKAFFAGHRDMYFPLLLSFYLIPFINLVPWVFLWGAYVLQDKDEHRV